MKLSENSHRKLQTFFREFLSDENFQLPIVNFYTGSFSNVFTRILKVHGITFGKRIFVMPELISKDFENRSKLPLELAVHEIVHVLQYRKEGFVKFFYKYLTSYWQNLKTKNDWNSNSRHAAYRDIPFEIEAREIAAEFVEWNREKKLTG